MEPLWSPVVATGGNQRQIGSARKWRKQAKTVAAGCHRLPETFHGKEGVDGSSPSIDSNVVNGEPNVPDFLGDSGIPAEAGHYAFHPAAGVAFDLPVAFRPGEVAAVRFALPGLHSAAQGERLCILRWGPFERR
jgi:hypothetical protein